MGIPWLLLAVLHVTALVHRGGSCVVRIAKEKDFVVIGESARLNCSSSCKGAFWETRLAKSSTQKLSDFSSTVQVQVKDWEDSPVQCVTESDNGTTYKEVVSVTPYALPSAVGIDLKTELEEGTEHEVKCQVDGVAPVRDVILSVSRGGEIFLSRTYEEDTRRGPQNLTSAFQFTATRSDNLQDFACQVTLNLTRVTNTTVSSPPVTVRTYALPEDPQITAEEWMEHGAVMKISCELLHGFPPENITTTMSVVGFPTTEVYGNVKIESALNTSDLPPAQHNVRCISQGYGLSKQSDRRIIVYEPPNATFTLSRGDVTVGDTVTINCTLTQGEAQNFGLSVSVDGVKVKRVNTPELTTNITITRRKANLSISCQIFIQENHRVLQTSEETLAVHYPPEFTDHSCPRSVAWIEGKLGSFGCRSDGNPTPEEQCSLGTWPLRPSAPFIPLRNMSGVYQCQASNSRGSANRSVEVTVQYPPDPPTLNISSSSVGEGGAVSFTCHSDALPAPTYSWVAPPHAQVNVSHDGRSIIIIKAFSYHNGTYTCEVGNQHGRSSAQQSLEVKSVGGSALWIALVPLLGIAVMAAIILLIVRHRRQRQRKGFYDVVGQNGGNAVIPMQALGQSMMNGKPDNSPEVNADPHSPPEMDPRHIQQ